MRKLLEILTPENVHVEYELAGLGSRFAALLIDQALQVLMIIIVVVSMAMGGIDFKSLKQLNSVIVAIGIVIVFMVTFGYFIVFELLMNGQTPGKKALKLRVIKQNGEPVSFFDSFLRNVLRLADLLPSLNLLGALFILFSAKYKRIGDLAANTVVVRVRESEAPVSLDILLGKTENTESDEKNVYPVNNFEYAIIKELLSRKDSLGARKDLFFYHLNRYFIRKFNIEKPDKDPLDFFEEIIRMNSGV